MSRKAAEGPQVRLPAEGARTGWLSPPPRCSTPPKPVLGQRMLAGDGMSQVTKTLLDLTQRKNFYAGDLLMSVEILRNVTDTFKRASYIPASDGVQVREAIP